MATVRYFIAGKKDPSKIRIRFRDGRAVDWDCSTGVSLNPKFWDKANQKIRNVIDVPNRDKLNAKLMELKAYVLNEANTDFLEGEVFDREWLEKKVATFAQRPGGKVSHKVDLWKVFFVDFAEWWLKHKAATHKVSASKYMTETVKTHYEALIPLVKEFEEFSKKKIKLKVIDGQLLDSLAIFLSTKGYSSTTIKIRMTQFKFFCGRAIEEKIDVSPAYNKSKIYIEKNEGDGYIKPYFDWSEIERIYRLDLSGDDKLDNIRDNFVIGLCTGMRVSDFLTLLKPENIKGDFIHLTTKKTVHEVVIPLHWMVKEILDKRGGGLPEKIHESKFNKWIRRIAEKCEFNEVMKGGIVESVKIGDKTERRKVFGEFPKHKLVTSHICRRSFATNNFKLISKRALMSICGWKKEQQMLDYIKLSGVQYAEELAVAWKAQDQQAA